MEETVKKLKRSQYIKVTLIYGLGLFLLLNFSWSERLGRGLYLGEQQGFVVLQYRTPSPFYRAQYRTRNKTFLNTSLTSPDYRERLASRISVDRLYDGLQLLEAALALDEREPPSTSRLMRSDFVIVVIIPCLLTLLSLLGHYWDISRCKFSWVDVAVCIAIFGILMAMLLPIAFRSRHDSEYTYETWKALTLPAGASVLDQQRSDSDQSPAAFVLYRLRDAAKTTPIFSSNRNVLIAEGGDFVVAAISDGRKSYRSLCVSSAVISFPISTDETSVAKLKIVRRVTSSKDDFAILSIGEKLPQLRYDFRKLTLTAVKK